MFSKFKNEFNIYSVFLILISSFFLLTNIFWIIKDISPPWVDPSWYLIYSHYFLESFQNDGLIGLIREFSTSSPQKAPLISLLPLPLFLIFQESHDVALMINLIALLISNYFFYKLLFKIRNNKLESLFGIIILNTFPLVYGLSRIFLVEYLLMTFVILWFYFLHESNFLQNKKYNFYLGILGGLGMLLKISFPIYIIAPTLIVLFYSYKKNKINFLLESSKTFFVILIISAIWYFNNLKNILNFIFYAGYGKASANYSLGPVFSSQTILKYWNIVINEAIHPFYFFVILFLLLFILTKKYYFKEKIIPHSNKTIYFLIFISIIFPFLFFTFSINKDYRFLLPIFPGIACFVSYCLFDIFKYYKFNIKKIILLYLLILSFPIYNYFYTSFNSIPNHDQSLFSYKIFQKNSPYSTPPQTDDWNLNNIISFIESDNQNEIKPALILIATHSKYINHNNMNYYDILRENNILFHGIAQKTNLELDKMLTVTKYIFIKEGGSEGSQFLNTNNHYIKDKILNKKIPFYLFSSFTLPDNSILRIYKKSLENEASKG